ncbi:hypothetical protein [Gorillibacterium sp. sgz5001074]
MDTLEIIKKLHATQAPNLELMSFMQKIQKALRQQCFESPTAK